VLATNVGEACIELKVASEVTEHSTDDDEPWRSFGLANLAF